MTYSGLVVVFPSPQPLVMSTGEEGPCETSNLSSLSFPSTQSTLPSTQDTHPSTQSTLNTFESKYRLESLTSTKSHKTSPIWEYFSNIDVAFHPDLKNYRVCLVCRDQYVDKVVSVGKDSSTAALISHLKTHKPQYDSYIKARTMPKDSASVSNQAQMTSYVSDKKSLSSRFKSSFGRFVVEDCMPLTICKSENFKSMIKTCNSHVVIPSYQTLYAFLQAVKVDSHSKMKAFLNGKFFSVTLDHWTSLAMENYGAITIHTIDNFQLFSFVLSCTKHPNGCTAAEMENQLLLDLKYWDLDKNLFFACVTDSASNMNSFGQKIVSWDDAPFLRHYYCADHVLQLTAVLAFSGNVAAESEDGDTSVSVIRKARNLVSHVNASVIACDKIRNAQLKLSPNCTPLKLVSDVETRWWSTHSLIDRIVKLKDPLLEVFAQEFRHRERHDRMTKLESLQLSNEDFLQLSDILYLLTPFKNAQKTLEGEQYVNFSLLPQIVFELKKQLVLFQAGLDPILQSRLFDLVTAMIDDFESRWGTSVQYQSTTVRAARNRQTGIPTYSFWAMALDPRTKKKLVKVLSEEDLVMLWRDISQAVLSIAEGRVATAQAVDASASTNASTEAVVARGRPRSNNKREYCFIADSSDDEEEPEVAQNVPVALIIEDELKRYQCCRGIPLMSQGQDNPFNCPLLWWKENHKVYPNIWELAQRVLAVPATSAPSERVFSSAANIVDKKRVRLDPDTVDLLIYLRGNKRFVDWDSPAAE